MVACSFFGVYCDVVTFPLVSCSPVENKNDLELDFKVFSSRILVVQTLYMMNPTDATLALLSVLKNSTWRPRWPSVMLLTPI